MQLIFTEPNQGQNIAQRIVRTPQDNLNQGIRMLSQQAVGIRAPLIPTTVGESTVSPSEPSEIPDNVTAELEKLEQEGAPMVEVEGVSAILEDLGDDDDELLGEKNNSNALRYSLMKRNKILNIPDLSRSS